MDEQVSRENFTMVFLFFIYCIFGRGPLRNKKIISLQSSRYDRKFPHQKFTAPSLIFAIQFRNKILSSTLECARKNKNNTKSSPYR